MRMDPTPTPHISPNQSPNQSPPQEHCNRDDLWVQRQDGGGSVAGHPGRQGGGRGQAHGIGDAGHLPAERGGGDAPLRLQRLPRRQHPGPHATRPQGTHRRHPSDGWMGFVTHNYRTGNVITSRSKAGAGLLSRGSHARQFFLCVAFESASQNTRSGGGGWGGFYPLHPRSPPSPTHTPHLVERLP
jgi:hypothetical protein